LIPFKSGSDNQAYRNDAALRDGGFVMTFDWRNGMMIGFIASVFVACLFGPYMISVMLGSLGLLCYLSRHLRTGA
jgi:hypothetical protein